MMRQLGSSLRRSPMVAAAIIVAQLLALFPVAAAPLPVVRDVEWQPFAAQVRRVIEALDVLGSPFTVLERKDIDAALALGDAARLQDALDVRCLVGVNINPEMRVKVQQGVAPAELMEQGWRVFLIKVDNESGTTAQLKVSSPNFKSLHGSPKEDIANRWVEGEMFDRQPMRESLSGLKVEYRVLSLYSRDAGQREAKLTFNVGQGTQDLGFRSELDVLFRCVSARPVVFRVKDENGEPTMASFVIRDSRNRVYPSQSRRLAPDFSFHPQVYRADGETVRLPDGQYTVEFSRGPESVPKKMNVIVSAQLSEASFQVERWVDPSKLGWWSGDHHIHAAGCAHYAKPSEGVHAPDMYRHIVGEDLKVGANLTWGPGFDYQKQFFCGTVDKVSQYPYLLRYDIEVSGFGSHESGHLVLLRLKDQMYPGGTSKDHWPKLGLNTLRWAKKQGAVVGPAHSGWGLQVDGLELPNYSVPKFDGIGANEYIMNVAHEIPGPDGKPVPAVDFISTVDTPYTWELNIWYHTLNAGFRTRISGETDFPCIYGEKVGLGRSYVKLEGKLDYDAWCEGIRQGRNYVGDGRSHLMDFEVQEHPVGEKGSEIKLAKARKVKVKAKVAARLDEQPNPRMKNLSVAQKPYWDIERARIGTTKQVPVEVLVNGEPVARKNIVADGLTRDIEFDIDIKQSSWVAMRILPSSHTNPMFVLVGDKPIRPSRKSIQWCIDSLDQCWAQKQKFMKDGELDQARADYDYARAVYQRRLKESERN